MKDRDIIERAEAEERIILTLDKDFRQLVLERSASLRRSGLILFRIHPLTVPRLAPLVERTLLRDFPWSGHVTTVTSQGVEMIPVARGT